MREILFRAKTYCDNWVFGYLIKGNVDNDFYIKENLREDAYWINPETVGQFTGLTVNGKKIFEGDIVRIKYEETTIEKAVVEYAGFGFYGATIGDYWELENYYEIEIIGNIHDKSIEEF